MAKISGREIDFFHEEQVGMGEGKRRAGMIRENTKEKRSRNPGLAGAAAALPPFSGHQ